MNFKENDLIYYVINNEYEKLQAGCERMQIKEIVGIRGVVSYEISLFGIKQNTKMWNPLLYAVVFRRLHMVKYLVEDIRVNAKLCLRDPAYSGEHSEVSPQYELRSKCFSVLIALYNNDIDMLSYLLNKLHFLWSFQELYIIFETLATIKE